LKQEVDKVMRCPVCGRGRVCDASSPMKKNSFILWPHGTNSEEHDLEMICPKCKSLIDIKLNKSA